MCHFGVLIWIQIVNCDYNVVEFNPTPTHDRVFPSLNLAGLNPDPLSSRVNVRLPTGCAFSDSQ